MFDNRSEQIYLDGINLRNTKSTELFVKHRLFHSPLSKPAKYKGIIWKEKTKDGLDRAFMELSNKSNG